MSARIVGMGDWNLPTVASRVRASVVLTPIRVAYLLWPGLGIEANEDAFSGAEGGNWLWYPAAGSFRPYRLPGSWKAIGAGGAVVGSLSHSGERVRFVPTSYWKRRGFSDWQIDVNEERSEDRWLQLATPRGAVVLRRR
jgi:hypothetical protein